VKLSRHRWILFVARRHFRTKRKEKGHTAGILSVLGIAAGVMTLITVLGVMNGFQSGTINDILELNSYHLQVESPDAVPTAEAISNLSPVRLAVPYTEIYGLALGYFQDPRGVMLRALPAQALVSDEAIGSILEVVAGSLTMDDEAGVVLGDELARRLGLRVGDTVSVASFGGDNANLARPGSVSLTITGLFKSGYLEFDGGWGFVSLDTARDVFGSGEPETIGVKLVDRFADRQAAAAIEAIEGVSSVVSWRAYNRAIFGALRLEKTIMMLLIGLIFVVVGVNIYQSLRRSVVERTEEIGVLKALGSGPLPIQLVFVVEGLWIGIAGAVIGTMIGLLISTNVNQVFALVEVVVNGAIGALDWLAARMRPGNPTTGRFSIFSPAYFYLDEVPSIVYLGEAIGVFLFATLSATIAAFFASRRVSAITPAQVLRFE
jgi:lipoprotein-releasing system permease protein